MPPSKKKTAILPEATDVGRVYTPHEVAELLKVSYRTVQEWIRMGKLGAVRYGRLYRIRAQDLDEFGRKTGRRA